jgi:hypothetical protein
VPAFGTVTVPVRSSAPIELNSPDGFMTEPPGDLWWLGLNSTWQSKIPPSVTRATAIIVNPLVRMPWVVRTSTGDELNPRDPGYPIWLQDPMMLNGSSGGPYGGVFPMLDRIDRFDLWARWIRDALWFGVGLIAFIPDSAGQPRAGTVQVVDPTRLFRSDDGWALAGRTGIIPIDDSGMIGDTGQRVVPLRHSLPTGVFGRHEASLELANNINTYAVDTFNTGVPSGVLTTDQPINQTQANTARDEWELTQQRRRIAVLGNGARYQQVTLSPLDAALGDMATLSNVQVAHMFEMAAWLLDSAPPSTTYTNAGDWRQDLVDGPLSSWSARIEETIGAVMPWGSSMTIDFTDYTTATTQPQEAPNGPSNPA